MGSIVKKNKQGKATTKGNSKPKIVGKFVVIPADRVLADRCGAYAYIF